jgi:four helix bundle protein
VAHRFQEEIMGDVKFSFEDLEVWRNAVEFADIVIDAVENLDTDRKHFRLIEQAEAAVTSIAMNIAEGKGRFSKREFIQYLYIARGSLFETIAILIIFNRRGWLKPQILFEIKKRGNEIGKMLTSLANSIKKSL